MRWRHFRGQSGGGGGGGGRFVGGGGDTLAAGTHGKCGGRERLAGVRGDHGGWAHLNGSQLLHFPLEPPVLLCEGTEPPLEVLALHLCLLQLAPA